MQAGTKCHHSEAARSVAGFESCDGDASAGEETAQTSSTTAKRQQAREDDLSLTLIYEDKCA